MSTHERYHDASAISCTEIKTVRCAQAIFKPGCHPVNVSRDYQQKPDKIVQNEFSHSSLAAVSAFGCISDHDAPSATGGRESAAPAGRNGVGSDKENDMQNIEQILGSSGMDLGQLGARFGLTPEQTRSALGSLMPAVLGGFYKQADNAPGGVANAAGMAEPHTSAGNDILGQIFGSKDVSRQVADHAADQSGISSAVLKAMLPIVAAMVARYLATNGGTGAGGGLGGILASVLGGGTASAGGIAGGLGGMFGGSGNPLDAILNGLRR
jgi:hypothetical protein